MEPDEPDYDDEQEDEHDDPRLDHEPEEEI